MKLRGIIAGALALAFSASLAFAQTNPGTSPLSVAKGGTGAATLTANGFILGNGAGALTSLLCTSAQLAVGQSAAAPICRTISGDVTIDASGVTAIGTAKVTSAMLRNSAALSVIGRSANSTGVPADIAATAASDAVLRESGSVVGFGTVATGGIANNAITDAKLRQSAGLSLVGRGASTTGNVADITSGADHRILRQSGTDIAFGAIDLSQSAAIGTSILALANGGCSAALTASNGGILWSNASQCQILAGIATANRPLLSGSSATPSWAAVSYPTSATSGGVAFFQSATVMGSSGLLAANGVMYGGGAGGAPGAATAGTNGQVLLGVTGSPPAMAAMSQDCTITNAGVITCTKTNNVAFGTSATVNTGTSGATIPLLNGNNAHSGTQDFQSAVSLTGDISPTQIAANTNDWAPTGFATASTIRLSTDASRNITGLAGGADGRIIILHNVGSFSAVLTNEDALSTAGNRFQNGGDVTLTTNTSITLRYDATSSRWRAITSPGSGGGGGSGTVTSATIAAGAGIAVSGTCTITTSGTCTVAQALTNATLVGSPTDPANTTSSTGVMMGLGVSTCRITTTYGTRLMVHIDGSVSNNSVGHLTTFGVRYGTGAGPSNGAALTGTAVGNVTQTGNGGATYQSGFSKTVIITGLSASTTYWLDLTLAASSGVSTMGGITCTAMEF